MPGSDWTAVTSGSDFTCAIRTDGTLWCWGNNRNGQLGLGDTTNRTTPAQVGGIVSQNIKLGRYTTYAIA